MTRHDQQVRLKGLIADLKKLGAGWTPDQATLAAAPLIRRWSIVDYPGTRDMALQGIVVSHPHLPDGPVTTSPIVILNLHFRWMRTHGRFYRLGKRATCKVESDDPFADEATDE
jgi:hypothetical protein